MYGAAMDSYLPFLEDDAPRRGTWSMLKRAFIKAVDPLGWHYARMSTDKSDDLGLFTLPAHAVTRRELARTPRHMNNADGKALVWAYIGDDDPTRGDSRGSTGLARQIAQALDGRMLYIDRKMLDTHFPNTRRTEEQLQKLIARDGTPDIIMGTGGMQATSATTVKPTMVVMRYNEYLRHDSTKLVSHDLTPEILADAGREFRARYPDLPGKLFVVLMASFNKHNARDAMKHLARLCAHEDAATVFFCPSRRTDDYEYRSAVTDLREALAAHEAENRVRIENPDFGPMRDGFNPYRGLLDQADHALLLGDSQSIVSEAVANGRPLYLGKKSERYTKLQRKGYICTLDDKVAERPLPQGRLAPISITARIAADLTAEFDRLARLRALGARHETAPAIKAPMVA